MEVPPLRREDLLDAAPVPYLYQHFIEQVHFRAGDAIFEEYLWFGAGELDDSGNDGPVRVIGHKARGASDGTQSFMAEAEVRAEGLRPSLRLGPWPAL